MARVIYKSELGTKIRKAAASPDFTKLHVIARDNKWIVKREGSTRAQKIYKSKVDAVKEALIIVKKKRARQVIVHTENGTIECSFPSYQIDNNTSVN